MVLYPPPADPEKFEAEYAEHIRTAARILKGKTRVVATRVLSLPNNIPPYYRITEIHFPSMESLQACINAPEAQETMSYGVTISTGGKPVFLVAQDEKLKFKHRGKVSGNGHRR